MMQSSNKLYQVEYTKSGRTSAKKCSESIPKDSLLMPMFDGEVPHWYHFSHFRKVGHSMWHPDEQKVKKAVEARGVMGKSQDGIGSKAEKMLGDFAAEYAKSNRSKHKGCCGEDRKGPDVPEPQLGMIDHWHHPGCFVKNRKELAQGFSLPAVEDKETLGRKQLPRVKSEGKREGDEVEGVDEVAKKKSRKKKTRIDQLKKRCSYNDLKKLVIFNRQQVPSRDMAFGALLPCQEHLGQLVFKSNTYYCTGDVTAWTKCMVTPKEFREISYLKKFKVKKQDCIFPTETSVPVAAVPPPSTASKPAAMNTSAPLSLNKDEVKATIEKLGGKLMGMTNKEVEKKKKMEEVKEDFLQDFSASTKRLQKLFSAHVLSSWGAEVKAEPVEVVAPRGKSGVVLSKKSKGQVKEEGGAVVDHDSGLEHSTHVLEKGGKIFSATLGLADIVKGTNSDYKLKFLKDDKESRHWMFRSWGHVGMVIGSSKLEQMLSKEDTIIHFMKYPKKFYPLEIDYGQDKEAVKKLTVNPGTESKLPKPVQDLIKMIFDVESMKKAMVGYEIDLQMPLGKLSQRQIQVQQAVSQGSSDSQILDLSNRFYILIPHDFGMKKPPLLNNADSVQAKVEMLDNLLGIEVMAYGLLRGGSHDSSKDPINVNYEKLKTDIKVVDRDYEEAEIIKKYVKNTHATTHNVYDLEVIDIFKIECEGECQCYKPFKQLLWHGSRTTNFAGILSQGLWIAPPDLPMMGYMFGKVIYFADLISKSANYYPIGLILSEEVALRNVCELNHAAHISKLPKGKHSVKGLGKTTPDLSASITMDGVEVPLETRISFGMNDTCLLYNEYIIYDVAQVNLKYLLKLEFNFKTSLW
uniref:Poly [ADP-ribose] polymerase n=1 Tax=Rhinopithecus roxellana TaxID=61622 RepID=A0A2K6QZB1_RHIRO